MALTRLGILVRLSLSCSVAAIGGLPNRFVQRLRGRAFLDEVAGCSADLTYPKTLVPSRFVSVNVYRIGTSLLVRVFLCLSLRDPRNDPRCRFACTSLPVRYVLCNFGLFDFGLSLSELHGLLLCLDIHCFSGEGDASCDENDSHFFVCLFVC